MNSDTPWTWDSAAGRDRLRADIERTGFSVFRDPTALEQCADPIAFGEALFGERPIRYQRMLIEPNQEGNQKTLPKTMFAGALHNDCAQLGVPPHVQVMVCERQSPAGGASLILDLWPILERISHEDSGLLNDLFNVPRAFPSGHLTRYGLTWSLCRGNLVCIHPTRARSGRVGLAFQRYIDETEPILFKCSPGDVYVNNNHRCLHGRQAFTDPTRRFVRFLFWFAAPLKAPSSFVELAQEGTQRLSRQLQDHSPSVRQLFGVDAPHLSAKAAEQTSLLLQTLRQPTNCDAWQGPGQRQLLVQEALLSALWRAYGSAPASPEELAATLESFAGADA